MKVLDFVKFGGVEGTRTAEKESMEPFRRFEIAQMCVWGCDVWGKTPWIIL